MSAMGHKAFEPIFKEMGFPTGKTPMAGAVVYSIARTYSLLVRELEQVYARFGLSAPSYNLLMLLKHGEQSEACSQREIGSRLVVSASDMTGLIDRLEKRGLVKRTPGHDRRCKLITITSAGSKLLDHVWPHHEDVINRVTSHLSHRHAASLTEALTSVRQAATGK